VRISAPARMSLDTIWVFAISRLGWIREQQTRLREHARASRREYLDGERHDVWGMPVLLNVAEEDAAPSVQLCHATLVLRVRRGGLPGTSSTGVLTPGAVRKSRRSEIAAYGRRCVESPCHAGAVFRSDHCR
jgi:hypothetical protein